jgi:hypothetical protein
MTRIFANSQRLIELMGLFIMGGCFIVAMISLERQSLSSKIELTIQVQNESVLKVFWGLEGQGYSELQSNTITVSPENTKYNLSLPPFVQFSCLRVDPGAGETKFVFTKFLITSERIMPIDLLEQLSTGGVSSQNHLDLVINKNYQRFEVVPSGIDPHFELCLSQNIKVDYGGPYFAGALALFLFFFGFLFRQDRLKGSKGRLNIVATLPAKASVCFSEVRLKYKLAETGVIVSQRDGSTMYHLELVGVQPGQEAEILRLIKQSNPTSILHLQYNRSGEV